MVEFILSDAQLDCLKAAVTIGSEESSVLGRSVRIGSQLFRKVCRQSARV